MSAAALPLDLPRRRSGAGPSVVLLAAAAVAVVLALRAAVPVTVLGLAIFGIAHECFELRYVIGRFTARLTSVFAALLAVIMTTIVLGRLAVAAGFVDAGRGVEICGGLGTLVAGAVVGLRGRRRSVCVAVVLAALAVSLAHPAYYLSLITHLHNVIPAIFLWDWSAGRLSPRARALFGATQVLWTLVVPLAILAGAADGWIRLGTEVVSTLVADGHTVLAASAPPHATALIATRWLVMFAYLQTMHYVVWIGFLPWFGRDATASFERRVPVLRGRRFVALVVTLAAGLAAVFFLRYGDGKLIYSAVATYHVYVEFPLLLLVLLGAANPLGEATAAPRTS